MTDRLFDQPTVKVFPDSLPLPVPASTPPTTSLVKKEIIQNESDVVGTAASESRIKPFSDVPLPPTVSLSSMKIERKKEQKIESPAAINAVPSYAEPTNSPVDASILQKLEKISLESTNEHVDAAIPSYARVSASVKKENPLPSYAQYSNTSAASTFSSGNINTGFSNNNGNMGASQLPLYAQMNSNSVSHNQPSYMSNSSVPRVFQPISVVQPVPVVPAFVPVVHAPRNDFVEYHGYKTNTNQLQNQNRNSQMQQHTQAHTTAVAWMNIYKKQSNDELYVLQEWFDSVDQDRSGEIDSAELEAALNAAGDKFDHGTIKLMVKIFDIDRDGTINFDEFTKLFRYINVMRQSFDSFDEIRIGILGVDQTRLALRNARYEFNDPSTVSMLFERFKSKESGGLSFELFMQLAIFLGNLRTLFSLHDPNRTQSIQLSEEEFILLDCAQFT